MLKFHFIYFLLICLVTAVSAQDDGRLAAVRSALGEDPENTGLLLELAERLSWQKDFAASEGAYHKLFELKPDHSEGRLKYARMLVWSGDHERALLAYSELDHFSADVQPLVALEGQAKRHVWYRELLAAERCLCELVAQDPNNHEARFDLGQVYCRLGLPSCAREQYRAILESVPVHGAAQRVLAASLYRCLPSFHLRYLYWREQGRDSLKDVDRHRGILRFTYPYGGGDHELGLECALSRYTVHGLGERLVNSLGVFWEQAWGVTGRSRMWAHLHYFGEEFQWSGSYGVTGSAYLWDGLRVSAGLEGEDILDNHFNFQEQFSSHTLWLSVDTPFFGPCWDLRAKLGGRYFSDDNWGVLHEFALSYQLSPSPRLLSVGAVLFIYHVGEETELSYGDSGEIIAAVHPYWTPHWHVQRGISIQWQHHPCETYFCEIDPFFYDIQYQLSSDRDDVITQACRMEIGVQESEGWELSFLGHYLHSDPYRAVQGQLRLARHY